MRCPLIRQLMLAGGVLVACAGVVHAQAPISTPGAAHKAYTGVLVGSSIMLLSPSDTTVPPLISYPEIGVVIKSSPADSAGLLVGDVIVEINGQDSRKASARIGDPELGEAFVLRIRRGGVEREVTLISAARPADLPSSQELWRMQRATPRSGT